MVRVVRFPLPSLGEPTLWTTLMAGRCSAERVGRRAPAGMRHRGLRRRGRLTLLLPGGRLSLHLDDEPENPTRGRKVRVRRRLVGAAPRTEIGGERRLVPVPDEAVVHRLLLPKEPTGQRDVRVATAAHSVALEAIALELEVDRLGGGRERHRVLRAENPEVAVPPDRVVEKEIAVCADREQPDPVGCVNSVFPANRMFCDVRPNLRTPQGTGGSSARGGGDRGGCETLRRAGAELVVGGAVI